VPWLKNLLCLPSPPSGNALFLIDVPAGQDGKAWSFSTFKSYSPLQLLNAPNAFAYSPQGVMKPEDAK